MVGKSPAKKRLGMGRILKTTHMPFKSFDKNKNHVDDKNGGHPHLKSLPGGEKDEKSKNARQDLGKEGEVDGYHVDQGYCSPLLESVASSYAEHH